jgi:peptide/histidine transporter 3/4
LNRTGLFIGVAFGSGAVKPNLIVMGGDQFDEDDPREAKMKSSYFSYFYWCTNVAAFVAFSIMVRLLRPW